MMLPLLLLSLIPSIFAQSSSSVVCIPGQCVEGSPSNATIGATLLLSSGQSIHLLPGVYTSTTEPKTPLRDALTSSSASLQPSAGFNLTSGSSLNLPLNLELAPGLSTYSGSLYSGRAAFTALPTSSRSNTTITLSGQSLAISNNAWIAVGSERTILWDAVPDINQLPASVNTLTVTDIQSSACTPSCSSNAICTPAGTCQCAQGFTGSSCESCSPGFFGPSCQACPADCDQCDDGTSGSGRCLRPRIANLPSSCNCENGVCGSDGQCKCTTGFGALQTDPTKCNQCTVGFFLNNNGDCEVCQPGCTVCSAGTGECTICNPDMTKDGNDPTKCVLIPPVDTNNQPCPAASFSANGVCTSCPNTCGSCTGGSPNDCLTCAPGLYMLNGACVSANADGICQGSNQIANNVKVACDTCGAKCTACRIPGFGPTSTVDSKQCTACIPGTFLSNGQCIDACPAGTTVSQDGFTCIPCDSGCATCAGSPSFCLTCTSNLVAAGGRCVSSCPSGTTPSSSGASCLSCHSDCASCSGPSFTQCTACPANRPVLSNGRCLPTCSKSQYFDKASGTCQDCDSSCASCAGAGGSQCLSCSSSTQVLRAGACVAASCASGSSVIPSLGICLSDLVISSTSTSSSPNPSISVISGPPSSGKRRLEWWQILLMALGCAFIFVVVIWLFRRRQRKNRKQKTAMFANGQRAKASWRWRLTRWGEKVFGNNKTKKVHFAETSDRDVEEVYETRKGMKLKILHLGSRDSFAPSGSSGSNTYPKTDTTTTDVHVHVPRNNFDTDLERGDEALRSPAFHSRSQSQTKFYDIPLSSSSNSKLVKPNPPFASSSPRSSHSRNGSTSSLDGIRISKPIPSTDMQEEEDMIKLIGSYNRPLSSAPSPPFTGKFQAGPSIPTSIDDDSDEGHESPAPLPPPTRIRLNPLHTRITPRDNGVGMRPIGSLKKPFGWKRQSRSNVPAPSPNEPSSSTRPLSTTSTTSSTSMYSQMTAKLLIDGDASRASPPPMPVPRTERPAQEAGPKNSSYGWI
ncbi:hypothetical protein CVT24_011097 [Panaeolus cyanescens]|uniref:EGF-like domain-containing protein n=1 Tax=Panaeolus cyanescens TaxID=181874 RepID=A0A409YG32_9AGAR|nr:hypothetical protein CVT24_011097 [Panaeolus cyanescens]